MSDHRRREVVGEGRRMGQLETIDKSITIDQVCSGTHNRAAPRAARRTLTDHRCAVQFPYAIGDLQYTFFTKLHWKTPPML